MHFNDKLEWQVMEKWRDMMTSLITAYDLDSSNETTQAMMRDCLINMLVQQRSTLSPVKGQNNWLSWNWIYACQMSQQQHIFLISVPSPR